MKVLTLSQKQLKEHSQTLAAHIQNTQIQFDMIIGIATGGVYVSRPLKEILEKKGWSGKYTEIKLSRPSTNIKKRLNVKSLLTKLPYPFLNILRNLEVNLFEFQKSSHYIPDKESLVPVTETLKIQIQNARTILLVDDAMDTGSTILAIKNTLLRINPNLEIKSAVLTITHKQPYIKPEYTLYHRVLLRCPWAEDYKGGDKIG